jgi:hypothetical protein
LVYPVGYRGREDPHIRLGMNQTPVMITFANSDLKPPWDDESGPNFGEENDSRRQSWSVILPTST